MPKQFGVSVCAPLEASEEIDSIVTSFRLLLRLSKSACVTTAAAAVDSVGVRWHTVELVSRQRWSLAGLRNDDGERTNKATWLPVAASLASLSFLAAS